MRGKGTQYQLVADTDTGPVIVTDLATPADLDTLEPALSRALRLAAPETSAALPAGWELVPVPEGGTALVESPRRRRRGGVLVGLFAAAFALTALWSAATRQPISTVVCTLGAGLLAWGAARLLLGRYEWHWADSRLRLVWRFRDQVRTVCEGDRLRLSVTTDGDNDEWYRLDLLPLTAPEAHTPRPRRIAHAQSTPHAPLALGEWLARSAGLALENHLPDAARRDEELAAMRQRLEASGRFGRWMAKLMPPAKPKG